MLTSLRHIARPTALRELARDTFESAAHRFQQRGRPALAWMLRLTAAAIASFAVADAVFSPGVHLLAPLTAMLVVQITPISVLRTGVERVVAVVLGVFVAIGFSSFFGLTWWSLGTAIVVSLALGLALRLGSNRLEVAISAMLVLGVNASTAESAAWQRISETLVGAGVGVLANLVYPPRVTTADAARSIAGLASDLAHLVEAAAEGLGEEAGASPGRLAERARSWLDRGRRLNHDIPNVGSALIRAEQSRRLNVRALAVSDAGPGLRQGMEALEHSAVGVRNLLRALVEAFQSYDDDDRPVPPDVLTTASLLLARLAAAVDSFGRLVRAESSSLAALSGRERTDHEEALHQLAAARADVAELMLVNPRDDVALANLTFFLLATVDRVIQELDLSARDRRRTLSAEPPVGRLLPRTARERSWTPHPFRRRGNGDAET